MIQEAYCSKETSKLLKEKGFDIPVNYEYHYKITIPQFHRKKHNFNGIEYSNCSSEWYSAPTHQMAMAWLREVHNLFIFPFPQRNTDRFWVEIYSIDKNKNEDDKWENLYCETIDLKNYSTYEEAVEAALKYCLKNLI